MNLRLAVGIVLTSATLGALAQTAQPPITPIVPPAAPPATAAAPTAAGPGATINAATGQPVPGTVAVPGVAARPTTAGVLTNRPGATVPRPPTVAATRSNITPAQMQNINRLAVELNGLSATTRDAGEQQRGLLETLQAAPMGNARPAPALISRLGADLATILPTLNLTAPQRRQLAIDLNLALNSGNLSPTEAQRVLADARSLLQGSTVQNPQGVEQLFAGLTTIINQLQGISGQAKAPPASGVAQQTGAPSGPPAADTTAPGTAPTQTGQSGGTQTGQGSGGSPTTPVAPKE